MRRTAALLAVLLTLAASARAQESVLLRIGGRAGQFNRYQATSDVFIRGGPMAAMMSPDTNLPMMHTTMFMTRTLTAIAGDTLTFQETVDSAKFDSPAMPQMAQMMGPRTLATLQGRVTVTRMNARAHIYSSEVTSPNAPPTGGRGGMGGGNGGRAPFMLPAQAVRVGESWTDTMVTPGENGAAPSTTVATLKLERVDLHGETRVAVVSMNGTSASQTPNGPLNLTITGEIQFDLAANRLAQISMTMTGVTPTPQGDVPIKMQINQTLM